MTTDRCREEGHGGRCDFCHAASQPLTAYPCHSFTILYIQRGDTLLVREVSGIVTSYQVEPGDDRVYIFVSVGSWAACTTCAALIDAGALDALRQRMVTCLAADGITPAHYPAVERQVLAALAGFWRHRLGLN